MNQKVAIVILNWNGEQHLKQFLPSVVRHSEGAHIDVVLIDNGSTDTSVGYIQQHFPSVRIIQLDANYGFTGGYNIGLQQVDADIAVLLNSDVEVTANWLQAPLQYMQERKDVFAVQPKILSYQNKNYYEFAGAAGGYIDFFGYPFCRGRIIHSIEKDEEQYNDIKEVFWASGACMFVRLDVFKAVGGFDDSFFAHMEEIDLCWRMKAIGMRIVCVPQSVVYHLGGGTLDKENPMKTFLNFRNNLMMLYKNLTFKQWLFVCVSRFFLDYLAALVMLLQGKPKDSWAVVRARLAFWKLYNQTKLKRKDIQRTKKIYPHLEVYKGSILFDFYVKKRNSFSSLKFFTS